MEQKMFYVKYIVLNCIIFIFAFLNEHANAN